MTILNIKEKDLTIIIPVKNGHTLLYVSFIHLFKHLNIKVEEVKPTRVLNNIHIFVRNPINRFFSSYYWLDYMTKVGADVYKNNLLTLLKKTNVSDIDSYINQYRNFLIECDDFHYIPQSCQILYSKDKIYKNELIDIQTDIKSLYDKNFGLNYKTQKNAILKKYSTAQFYFDNEHVIIINQSKKKHCDYLTVYASQRQIVLLLAAEINDDEFVHLTLNPVTIGLKTAGSR